VTIPSVVVGTTVAKVHMPVTVAVALSRALY
jgi:hypothetical protein